MNRGGAEAQRLNEVAHSVIGACIEIHRALGPGLLESAYSECLCHELTLRGLVFERELSVPVRYKNVNLDCGYRIDLLVERSVVVELKAVESLHPIHEAHLLTYLRLLGLPLGLIINFHVEVLKDGVRRLVHNFPDPPPDLRASAPPRFL